MDRSASLRISTILIESDWYNVSVFFYGFDSSHRAFYANIAPKLSFWTEIQGAFLFSLEVCGDEIYFFITIVSIKRLDICLDILVIIWSNLLKTLELITIIGLNKNFNSKIYSHVRESLFCAWKYIVNGTFLIILLKKFYYYTKKFKFQFT